jgi:hypothetical protein
LGQRANLSEANLRRANLNEANLREAQLNETNLTKANLCQANLSDTDLTGAKLIGAELNLADLSGACLIYAVFSNASLIGVKWDRKKMRSKYIGIQGLNSCHGSALFIRDAADQDFLDSLEAKWNGTWRMALFWAWGFLDYGRSLGRVVWLASLLVVFYGLIYSICPGMLDYQQSVKSSFTPYYFSIVTYTTLGFGDVKPKDLIGEIIVSTEVIMGYTTLGLLLAVLAEKIARRS